MLPDERVSTAVIGAGQAGLATSHFLSERSVDHVVIERGDVGDSWRRGRWDSMRLLTPNWMNRLPGLPYDGPDRDGYMSSGEMADVVERFAARIDAPLRTGTTVTSVTAAVDGGFEVATDDGRIDARTVVLASGAFNHPSVPPVNAAVPPEIAQFTTATYRRPSDLPDGGVLVVGASASGAQIAAELQRSGRQVVLSVGEHVRMPRTYRGRDVLWWMDRTGIWGQRYDELDDITRVRRLPSPQLAGTPERATLDLNALTTLGVELVGRLAAVRGSDALFSGGLRNVLRLADLKLVRLLDGFDVWAREGGHDAEVGPIERPAATTVPDRPRLRLDLRSGEVRSILWATGFRPDYSWLNVHCLDAKGQLRHDGGVVTSSPGLYALGLPVLRRRRSTFVYGIESDAREVIGRLAEHLDAAPPRAAAAGR